MAENDIVEKVARAIYEAFCEAEGIDATWEELRRMNAADGYATAKKWHRLAFVEARAAIEALRDPTEAMIVAGAEAIVMVEGRPDPPYYEDYEPDVQEYYREQAAEAIGAAIDAALSNQPDTEARA